MHCIDGVTAYLAAVHSPQFTLSTRHITTCSVNLFTYLHGCLLIQGNLDVAAAKGALVYLSPPPLPCNYIHRAFHFLTTRITTQCTQAGHQNTRCSAKNCLATAELSWQETKYHTYTAQQSAPSSWVSYVLIPSLVVLLYELSVVRMWFFAVLAWYVSSSAVSQQQRPAELSIFPKAAPHQPLPCPWPLATWCHNWGVNLGCRI